jgi:hypothetical protein
MQFFFIFLCITIFDPSRFFGNDKLWDAMSILTLSLGCIRYFPVRSAKIYYTPILNTKGFILFLMLLLLFIISLFRTHSFLITSLSIVKNSTTVCLIPIFLYLFYQYESQNDNFSEKKFIMLIIDVLGIYCLANIIAFIVKPTYDTSAATTLRFIGINTRQILFPLNPNIHPGIIGALGGYLFVLSASYLKHIKNNSSWVNRRLYLYIISGIVTVLMSDSRTILFSAVLCVAGLFIITSINKLSLLKYLIWVIPFSNIIFMSAMQYTASTSIASSISRNNNNDIATGNSRKFIYMAANRELADFKPIHMIGFGEYGPYAAGLTKYYMADKFYKESKKETLISSVTHNTALQVIFDIGYIGLAIYLLFLFTLFSQLGKMSKAGQTSILPLAYIMTYIMILGTSETYFGNYTLIHNYLFFLLTFFIVISYNNYLNKKQLTKKKYDTIVT